MVSATFGRAEREAASKSEMAEHENDVAGRFDVEELRGAGGGGGSEKLDEELPGPLILALNR